MKSNLAVIALAVIAAPGFAHDFWIDPTTFTPELGAIAGLRLRVGQEFLGDPVPNDPSLINQFIYEDAAGRKPVVGRRGSDPAGLVRVSERGLLVVGYLSNPSPVEMDAAKFNQYLKDEGLDTILALRAQSKRSETPGRELFSRCAKTLLLSGPPTRAQADRRLGLTLELVAERNPYTLAAGDELPVQLTYEGRPLAGALVVAINRDNPSAKVTARTAAGGHARLRLTAKGTWLVKAVHMVPAPAGVNAEWSSFWASSTFEVRN